jgi:hypothetical protein
MAWAIMHEKTSCDDA